MNGIYIEADGYCFYTHAQVDDGGFWRASAYFEKLQPLSITVIPGIRHRLPEAFAAESQALVAAAEFAYKCIETGEIGL
ncbi:MAG: hypothetical protein ACRYF5_18690 [Janthinobacterium lividum]